jgi:phosphate/phosphite/phosphonate ABC transporter binding protein
MVPLRVGVAQTVTATRSVMTPRPAERSAQHLVTFCENLARVLDRPVEPVTVESYTALVEAMRAGAMDIAWLPPVIAIRAAEIGRAMPLAMPVRHGVSTFHAALFSRADSRFRELRDVFGARAAWVDKSSAAGYLVVRASLRARGLGFENAFRSEAFVGSHDAVAKAVQSGEADVGATYVHLRPEGTIWRAGWGDAKVQVITRVGPIPSDLLAASTSLPAELLRRIQRAIVEGDDPDLRRAANHLLEAEGFVEVESSHLEPLASLLRFVEDVPQRMPSVFPPPRRRRTNPPQSR